ncbi:MAG: hypothetical protein BWY06_03287 [Candidatus Latescibacteria bacterium ADurb.Bin168]|nr:MAG: hypothetical protein BWY06_03287 [Candidatus Latescibacteria bacterium ADurb.Bin168]
MVNESIALNTERFHASTDRTRKKYFVLGVSPLIVAVCTLPDTPTTLSFNAAEDVPYRTTVVD